MQSASLGHCCVVISLQMLLCSAFDCLPVQITLMETDEFPDPKAGLPAGIHTWTGSSRPMRPEQEASMEAFDEGDEDAAAALAAAAEAAELQDAQEEGRAGTPSYNAYRMFTDEDGTVLEDGDSTAGTAGTASAELDGTTGDAADPDAVPGEEGGGSSSSSKGRKGRPKAVAAAAAADGEDEGEDELPREFYDPPEQPVQIKMEWVLMNKGEGGGWAMFEVSPGAY